MRIILSVFSILLVTGLNAQSIIDDDFNFPYEPEQYQEIVDNRDNELQQKLDYFIQSNPQWRSLAKSKRLAVGLVDLRDCDDVKFASVNGRHMMYAASLPKIAVLLAAMEAIDEGCLKVTPELKSDMRLMIAKSNNQATTRVIERIGIEKIADVMRSDKYDLYDKSKGGGLWVGKKYAKADVRIGDPLKGISHAATIEQVCRFYTMMAYGKLVNEDLNEEIMKYMIDPEINHKFVKTLRKIAPDAEVYRKSGSWRNFHADSALVNDSEGRKYILVALIEDANGSSICSDLVYAVENILEIDKSRKDILASRNMYSHAVLSEKL